MAVAARPGRGGMPPRPTTWRERLGALRNLPPFLAMVWHTSRLLTATTLAVRLVRALLPIATLFDGKLIIDEVVHLKRLAIRLAGLAGWLGSGLLGRLEALLLAEFTLAVGSDLLGRLVSLVDGLPLGPGQQRRQHSPHGARRHPRPRRLRGRGVPGSHGSRACRRVGACRWWGSCSDRRRTSSPW